MRNLAQEANLEMIILPVNLATGANPAIQRIDMRHYNQVNLVIVKAAGAAAEPVVVTVLQANAATAGTTKALPLSHGVFVKSATNGEDATAFVEEVEDSAGVYTGTTSVQKEGFIVIPIRAEDLDSDGGYRWIDASIASVGIGAQVGAMFAVAFNARYTPPPAT